MQQRFAAKRLGKKAKPRARRWVRELPWERHGTQTDTVFGDSSDVFVLYGFLHSPFFIVQYSQHVPCDA